jgi:outer membrane lipoprotein-sorting protein
LLLLLALTCAADDWQTYRCLVRSLITYGDFSTETFSSVACKKSGKETWMRTTQIRPEKDRTVIITKGKSRTTYYPDRNSIFTGVETGEFGVPALEDLFKDASQGNMGPGVTAEFNIPASSPFQALGAAKITLKEKSTGNTTVDSLVLYDSTRIATGFVTLVRGVTSEDGGTYPLPLRLTYKHARSGIIVNTLFSGYRVNEPVPDETFEISNEK